LGRGAIGQQWSNLAGGLLCGASLDKRSPPINHPNSVVRSQAKAISAAPPYPFTAASHIQWAVHGSRQTWNMDQREMQEFKRAFARQSIFQNIFPRHCVTFCIDNKVHVEVERHIPHLHLQCCPKCFPRAHQPIISLLSLNGRHHSLSNSDNAGLIDLSFMVSSSYLDTPLASPRCGQLQGKTENNEGQLTTIWECKPRFGGGL